MVEKSYCKHENTNEFLLGSLAPAWRQRKVIASNAPSYLVN